MPIALLSQSNTAPTVTTLPSVLQTPSGLILVEVQGTIHVGAHTLVSTEGLGLNSQSENAPAEEKSVRFLGTFDFSQVEKKEITLVIDEHQCLRGKITKLKAPLAVLKMDNATRDGDGGTSDQISIPIMGLIESKVVFSTRPEPIVYKNT